MTLKYALLAQRLGQVGHCISPNFLSPQELLEVRCDLGLVRERGAFARAGTGQGSSKEIREEVRRDEICWLDRLGASFTQSLLWEKLDSLQLAFNRTLFLGLNDFEGHYAAYPPGGFYKRHLDCFQNDNARVVSIVLYLNSAWCTADGGLLRLYHEGSSLDVSPVGGTLVCFLSRELEHEVLPSHAERLSFTGWFKGSRG